MATIFTIGHSTRAINEFIIVLKAHAIEVLVDIRAFPASSRLPHFNREAMLQSLTAAGIEYRWQPAMGGRRKRIRTDSPNTALRSDSFRNYADHMLTPEFQEAAAGVLELAKQRKTTIMCAEKLFFQCHRMMVSDYYTAHGDEVLHIVDEKPPTIHQLMREAQLVDGELVYNAGRLF